MRWVARVLGVIAVLLFVGWATDDAWAVPMIVAAPNAGGPRPTDAPDDAKPIRVLSEGEEIEAWVLPADEPRATVVVLHGIHDRKDSMVPLGRALNGQGFQAILVDLRGHGASTGTHLSYGVHDRVDLRAILDVADSEGLLVEPVGVHGVSYGASTAILFAAHDPRVQSVVAIAPFASLREVVPAYGELIFGPVGRVLPSVWINDVVDRAGVAAAFNPDEACPRCAAEQIRAPLFLAHGDADVRIPPWHGELIARAHAGPTEVMVVPGANHGTIGGEASARAHEFLRRTLLRE
ncbi:MAG: alpha/beta fold hydrolase [Myxococcota bacterium]